MGAKSFWPELRDARPCPKCGRDSLNIRGHYPETGEAEKRQHVCQVHCPKCGLAGPIMGTWRNAVKAWNKLRVEAM